MDFKPSPRQSSEYKSFRRKYYQNITAWANTNIAIEDEKPVPPVDVAILVQLLQALGFKLANVKKTKANEPRTARVGDDNAARIITITCSISGLEATLHSFESECRCSGVEPTMDAEFWEVSGSAPMLSGKKESPFHVREAGSSLIPMLVPPVAAGVKDVLSYVLTMISDSEIHNVKEYSNLLKHHHIDRPIDFPQTKLTKQVSESTLDLYAKKYDTPAWFTRSSSTVELGSRAASSIAFKKVQNSEQSSSFSINSSLEKLSLSHTQNIVHSLETAVSNIQLALSLLHSEKKSCLTKEEQQSASKENHPCTETFSSSLEKAVIPPKCQFITTEKESMLTPKRNVQSSSSGKKQHLNISSPPPSGEILKKMRISAAPSSSTPSHIVNKKKIHSATPRPKSQFSRMGIPSAEAAKLNASSTARNIYEVVKKASRVSKEKTTAEKNNLE